MIGKIGATRNGKRLRYRRAIGAASVMLTACIPVLIAVVVGGSSLVLQIGTASYYKDKLNFIADQAAAYAAGELSWCNSLKPGVTASNAQAVTAPIVANLLQQSGFPATANFTVTADDQQVTVNFSVRGVAMPAGAFLPSYMDLNASATKRFDFDQPPAVCLVGLESEHGRVLQIAVPAYNGTPVLRHSTSRFFVDGGMGRVENRNIEQ